MAQRNMMVGDSVTLAVEGRTGGQQNAPLPTTPVWTATPPGVLVLTPDGAQCLIQAVGPGDATLSITCGALPAITFTVAVAAVPATHLVVRVVG